jgi:hypothetical protein
MGSCQTIHIKELPNSTTSPRTRTVRQPRATDKQTINPDTSIPGKRWNTPTGPSSCRKKLIESPRRQQANRNETALQRESTAGIAATARGQKLRQNSFNLLHGLIHSLQPFTTII